jgi:hypothetical protein
MFFRSIHQGFEANQIELEIITTLKIYYTGVHVETFPVTLGPGGIALLRSAVNAGSDYIRMFAPLFDIFDPRGTEDDTIIGATAFARTHMRGGSGPPTDDAGLNAIRTGPERAIIILATTEDDDGSPLTPPWTRRVQQWTGSDWVTFANLVPRACPYIGTS